MWIWCVQALLNNFTEDDAELICTIPLSNRNVSNMLYWWPSKDRIYIVKLGYCLDFKAGKGSVGDSGSNNGEELWRELWGLQIPPKLAHFVWRACLNHLLLKLDLFSHHIVTDARCGICGSSDETIVHSLFNCDGVKDIWVGRSFSQLLIDALNSGFTERLLWAMHHVNKEELDSIGLHELVSDYRIYSGCTFSPQVEDKVFVARSLAATT